MTKLSPKKIVQNLDKFIIGQNKAKKLVAIAIRNRWRRKNIKSYIRNDIVPHNILMIGPTGSTRPALWFHWLRSPNRVCQCSQMCQH